MAWETTRQCSSFTDKRLYDTIHTAKRSYVRQRRRWSPGRKFYQQDSGDSGVTYAKILRSCRAALSLQARSSAVLSCCAHTRLVHDKHTEGVRGARGRGGSVRGGVFEVWVLALKSPTTLKERPFRTLRGGAAQPRRQRQDQLLDMAFSPASVSDHARTHGQVE